jgi:F-type H+-transporting ATPase subunit epsilon
MARGTFPVEVLTPEGKVFEGEVEMISTHTAGGSIGVLANHAPLLAMLDPAELKLYESGSADPASATIERFAQGEGYLQVADNAALILVEDAVKPEDLDHSALETSLKEAQDAADRADDDSAEEARARRDIRRIQAFLDIEA